MRWTRSVSSERPGADHAAQTTTLRPPEGFWAGVRRMLPFARTAMEYCWLYPWLVVIGGALYGSDGPLLSAGWTLLLLLGGQAAVRPMLDRGGSLPRSRAILVGAGVVIGFLAIHARHYPTVPVWSPEWIGALLQAAHNVIPDVPKPVFGALLAACLWWRGLVLGAREVNAPEIESAYKIGVGMIVLYFLAAAVYSDTRAFDAAGRTLPGSLPAFFFLGLSALALARLGTIWDRGQPDERAHFPARAWILLIIGIVGLILLAASMMAGLAAADVLTYVGILLRPVLPVLEVLFLVLFFVAGIVVRIAIAILSHLPRRPLPQTGTPPSGIDDLIRRLRDLNMNPQVVEGARWGMVFTVLLLLVIGMALTIVLLRRRERQPDEDEHESVWSAREAFKGLAGLLLRLRRRRPAAGESAVPEAKAIRLIYRELLALGAGIGAPRPTWATPREHDPRLRRVFSEAADAVGWLTVAYEQVRYGTWRPTPADVHQAQDTLVRAKALAKASSEARSR